MKNRIFLLGLMSTTLIMPAVANPLNGVSQEHWLPRCETALNQGRANNVITWLETHKQDKTWTPEEQILGDITLGKALLRNGRLDDAEQVLKESYLKTQKDPVLHGEVCLRLGHVAGAKGQVEAAQNWYKEALQTAQQGHDVQLQATARINLHRLNPVDSTHLAQAAELLNKLPVSAERTDLWLSLGYEALKGQNFDLADKSLKIAQHDAQEPRHLSQALGYRGHSAEQQKQLKPALALTEQAIVATADSDLLMQWQWQRGRLLNELQQSTSATAALRQAIEHLQSIKQNIPVVYQHGASSFRETYAPLYMTYIEQLLKEVDHHPEQSQKLLDEVLNDWEQLKTVELQDYFRQSCAVQQKNMHYNVPENTAVLYPILLPKRIAMVVRFPERINVYTTPVDYPEVRRTVRRSMNEILSPMNGPEKPVNSVRKLYSWLIKPIQADLQQHHIDTVLYLPDGPLRSLPLSVLGEGGHYLAESYKIVTIPGISLLEAQSQTTERNKPLLTGMSKPGPVVEHLLSSSIDIFSEGEESSNTARGLRGLPDFRQGAKSEVDRALRANELKQQLELPGVTVELNKLSGILKTDYLENEKFTLDAFKQKIAEGHSFVHIASHGFFSGDPNKSFIMTYDKLLNMTELNHIFQNEAFLKSPVDLITLSACQTAQGDDRSPLGLSGVVVQTGVRSAIGTLWPVGDDAAQQFFSDFYSHYKESGVTKAEALKTAQQHLMEKKEFKHPLFWAPFVLVGDWK